MQYFLKSFFKTARAVPRFAFCIVLLNTLFLACINPAVEGDDDSSNNVPENAIKQGRWRSIAHSIQGSWYIVQNGAKLQVGFGTDFSTDGGPDLYLYLSPQEPSAITSNNGAAAGAIEIKALENSKSSPYKGPVIVDLPEGTDLSLYKSIIIHCKQYSATWGVGTL